MTIPDPDTSSLPWHVQWGFDAQEFSAGGVRTFAVVEGPATLCPVVFIHGLPGGAFLWAPVIRALKRNRRAVAPDQPGWGRSISRFGGTLPVPTPAGLAQWVLAVAAAQDLERFDLVAHGSGSWLALELLATDPARVRRLALVSPRLWEPPGRRPRLARLLGREKWTPAKVTAWLDRRSALQPAARADYREQFDYLLGPVESPRSVPALSEQDFAPRFAGYRAALTAFPGALLLIWGRNDPAAPATRVQELAAALPHAEAVVLDQAGHFPTLDQPDETARRLAEFLTD